MAWQFIIAVAIGGVLVLFASYKHRAFVPRRRYDFRKLVISSFGLGASCGFLVWPTVWLAVSYSFNKDRPIEQNLAPDTDVNSLLVSLIIGTLLTTWAAAEPYLPHVTSRKKDDE